MPQGEVSVFHQFLGGDQSLPGFFLENEVGRALGHSLGLFPQPPGGEMWFYYTKTEAWGKPSKAS